MNLTTTTTPTPHSQEAEDGLLSCFLQCPDLLADAVLTIAPADFHHAASRLLYSVMLGFNKEGRRMDLVTLSQFLIDGGMMDRIGGPSRLAELYNYLPAPTLYAEYRRILHNKAKLRGIISACTDIATEAHGHHEDLDTFLAAAGEKVFAALKQRETAGRRAFGEILEAYLEEWEGRLTGEVPAAVPSRWPSWNEAFGGITPRYWLIAGYPSDGKSALMQNLMEDMLAAGRGVLVFSHEMDELECTDRLVSARTQIDSRQITFPHEHPLTREDLPKITRAVAEMQPWKLHLRCEPTWTIEQIVAETRVMMRRHPDIGLVACDYLQLVATEGRFGSRAEQVAHVSRTWKREINGAHRVASVMLSQLNDDGRTLDSRAPNQDANNIVFIEKDGLRVVKNRGGVRDEVLPITLKRATYTFENADIWNETGRWRR